MAVYANKDDPERVLVHIVLTWDTPADATEFLAAYLASVQAANGQKDLWDRSSSARGLFVWDDEDEHISAVLDERAFTLVVATDRDDRDTAVAAMRLPAPITTPGAP
jgi:hypothetical protein